MRVKIKKLHPDDAYSKWTPKQEGDPDTMIGQTGTLVETMHPVVEPPYKSCFVEMDFAGSEAAFFVGVELEELPDES